MFEDHETCFCVPTTGKTKAKPAEKAGNSRKLTCSTCILSSSTRKLHLDFRLANRLGIFLLTSFPWNETHFQVLSGVERKVHITSRRQIKCPGNGSRERKGFFLLLFGALGGYY